MSDSIRLMVIGAHPDDCEITAAGLALTVLKNKNNVVKFMSVSNGCRGHMTLNIKELDAIRAKEAKASGEIGGYEYEVLDINDCEVTADLKTRELITEKIREFAPNVIVTHRPNDYHPDHRNTSLLIQDSAYLLAVPHFVPNAPALKKMPVIMYMSDTFKKPYEFEPDIILDVEEFTDKKARMMTCHKSQFFEWLPWIDGYENEVPTEYEDRVEFIKKKWLSNDKRVAEKYSDLAMKFYGRPLKSAEAFEISEYGTKPDPKELFKALVG